MGIYIRLHRFTSTHAYGLAVMNGWHAVTIIESLCFGNGKHLDNLIGSFSFDYWAITYWSYMKLLIAWISTGSRTILRQHYFAKDSQNSAVAIWCCRNIVRLPYRPYFKGAGSTPQIYYGPGVYQEHGIIEKHGIIEERGGTQNTQWFSWTFHTLKSQLQNPNPLLLSSVSHFQLPMFSIRPLNSEHLDLTTLKISFRTDITNIKGERVYWIV